MANSQPRTGAVIPEAVRLERVRRERGHGDSLWNFWKEVCSRPPTDLGTEPEGAVRVDDDGNYAISYEAARNYHHDRHAPGHYYAQVAAVFDVRLEYLLGLGGGMTREEDNALRLQEIEVVDGMVMLRDWTEEQRREARLRHLLHRPEPASVGVMFAPIPTRHEREAMISFCDSWLRRTGVDRVARILTEGAEREPTEQDVADFYYRVFLAPLRSFGVDQQRLAAFHSRMAVMWLQDLVGEPWWETPAPLRAHHEATATPAAGSAEKPQKKKTPKKGGR